MVSAACCIYSDRLSLWDSSIESTGDWIGFGMGCFQEIAYQGERYTYRGFIDLSSTFVEGERTFSPVYKRVGCIESFAVAVIGIYSTPFLLYIRVLFAALHLVFRLGQLLANIFLIIPRLCMGKFSWKDLSEPLQLIAKSIWEIIKAPFFALAYALAHAYTLVGLFFGISPLYGRKLAAYIMRAWNDGLLHEGGHGKQANRAPQMLSCMAPVAYAEMDGEEIVHVVNLARNRVYSPPAKDMGKALSYGQMCCLAPFTH